MLAYIWLKCKIDYLNFTFCHFSRLALVSVNSVLLSFKSVSIKAFHLLLLMLYVNALLLSAIFFSFQFFILKNAEN